MTSARGLRQQAPLRRPWAAPAACRRSGPRPWLGARRRGGLLPRVCAPWPLRPARQRAAATACTPW